MKYSMIQFPTEIKRKIKIFLKKGQYQNNRLTNKNNRISAQAIFEFYSRVENTQLMKNIPYNLVSYNLMGFSKRNLRRLSGKANTTIS